VDGLWVQKYCCGIMIQQQNKKIVLVMKGSNSVFAAVVLSIVNLKNNN